MISSGRTKWQMPEPMVDMAATGTAASKFPVIWYDEVSPNLDATDIVQDTICEGQMSVVYGDSNTGKTFFASDLALHLAIGEPWRGKAVEQGGVIYVAAEGGFGIRNRVAAFRLERQGDGQVDVPFAIVPASVNLLDPAADAPKLIELIKEASQSIGVPVKLVVIDTLSRAMAGGNENSPDDMGALVINGDRIRQATGAHLMFIHHSGKDAARGARGHSLLRAATDTEIEVSREAGADHSVAKVMKQREMAVEGEYRFGLRVIELGVNRRGRLVTSCVVDAIDAVTPASRTPRRKMSPQQENCLSILRDMCGEEGTTQQFYAYGYAHQGVAFDLWQRRCVAARFIVSDNEDNQRRSLERVAQALANAKMVVGGSVFGTDHYAVV
jgi:hypothetical protein